jgi:uncharacterized membrane protein
MPLFTSPSASTHVLQIEKSDHSVTAEVPRTFRVAIYDEPNGTAPAYTGTSAGGINNNATGMAAILESEGYTVDIIDVHDISERKLITANYDVFVLVDNFPRENITNLVWDFWKGGGGILALDGSAIFLCFMGILPPEAAGTTGQGVLWDYVNNNFALTTRHPVSKSYEVPSLISGGSGMLVWYWNVISTSSIAGNLVRISTSTVSPTTANILAYDAVAGGKVVTIASDLESQQLPALYQMYRDAADWLTLRPKARIAFDYTHLPRLGVDNHDSGTDFPGSYPQMRDLLVSRDYSFDKLYPTSEGNLTSSRLGQYDLLVLVSPDYNYTSNEVANIQQWVGNGGSLLIMGDKPTLSTFAACDDQFNRILEPFDMYINITDGVGSAGLSSQDHDEPILERTNSGLYMSGAGFINFTGSHAVPLWTYGTAVSVASQEFQNGRVVVCVDMNWASNAFIANNDNSQFVINVVNWLSAADGHILLFVNEPYSENYFVTPVALALNNLGLKFYLTADEFYFNLSLLEREWDLVVADNPWGDLYDCYSNMLQHVQNGGRFIMSDYQVGSNQENALWTALGFEFAYQQPDSSDVFIWLPDSPVFNIPNHYGAINFTPTVDYGDEGDLLRVTTGNALAGYNMSATDDNATIVLGSSGKTLYNGYLIDQFAGDNDDSTYPDNFELWENEIAYIMRPILNHPADINMVEGDDMDITWSWSPIREYSFNIFVNGSLEDLGTTGEHDEGVIQVNLNSLASGIYEYEFSIADSLGFSDSDIVIVNVSVAPPTTTPSNETPDFTTILLVGAGVGIVIVVVIVFIAFNKKKTSS